MKESLARITAWVKAHPYISAAILLVVVLLGYLAYKRGMFSGSASESQISAEDNSGLPPESGIGGSSIPDLGAFGTPSTSGGGITTSSSDTSTDNQGESQYGYGAPSVPLPLPQFEMTPTLSDLSTLQSTAASQSGYSSGGALAVAPATPAARLGVASGGAAGGDSKSAKGLGVAKSGKVKKPSELVGKGPNFTGVVDGIYYLMGNYGTGTYNGKYYVNGRASGAIGGGIKTKSGHTRTG